MKMTLGAIGFITISIALVMFVVGSSASYITSNNKEDQCEKAEGKPEQIANSLINSSVNCRIVGKGPFYDEEFIHLTCNPGQGGTIHKYVFVSNEACGAFKKLTSVEYIKLHLTTMLPPNKASQPTP
jgi:hypothetical protein